MRVSCGIVSYYFVLGQIGTSSKHDFVFWYTKYSEYGENKVLCRSTISDDSSNKSVCQVEQPNFCGKGIGRKNQTNLKQQL